MKSLLKGVLNRIGAHVVQPYVQQVDPRQTRTAPATKVVLIQHMAMLRGMVASGAPLPPLKDCGFRIFSQFEEDGYLAYLAAVLDLPRTFVDVGAADGINSNCANLAVNLGWHGMFIEGSEGRVATGRAFYKDHPDTILYPPIFKQAFITAENINALMEELPGEIGICSIDIDGNDFWVWKAMQRNPGVVVIETHIEFGMRDIVVPYDADYFYPGRHPDYHGASPVAMVNMARGKGYRLVGANNYGFNLIFVRNDLHPDRVPEVALESVLRHPRYADRLALFEPIKDWDYVASG